MTSRNYGHEARWAAQKYGQLAARLDKDLVDQFKKKLADEGTDYSKWLKQHILDYLAED